MAASVYSGWLAMLLSVALSVYVPVLGAKDTQTSGPDGNTARKLQTATDGVQELEWEALVPEGWRPDDLLREYDVDQLDDSDPRAQELMSKLQALWSQAPVVEALDGKTVKLPGFVVPLEGDGEKVSEFLLVPYFGACIHVPPPPANQTVYVVTGPSAATVRKLFDVVWVTGVLRAKTGTTDLAEAGYTLHATTVEPYEE